MDITGRRTRCGLDVVVFGEFQGFLFGAYEAEVDTKTKSLEWLPLRWNAGNGRYNLEASNNLDLMPVVERLEPTEAA